MRIAVIGGTGHIGSYLIPRLVQSGHQVISLSRGERAPYLDHDAWSQVEHQSIDRVAEDAAGTFADRVAALEAEVVIDLICFDLESAQALIDGLRGKIEHLLHCGSIWMHGPSQRLPITEDGGTTPVGEYGIQKAAIAKALAAETRSGGLITTSLHPGHISGPGWPVINPLGNLDPSVWEKLADGVELIIPGLGAELMHHVHADDVAQAFALAVEHRDQVAGEMFHVTAASALTVRGYAEIAASWFGREAQLRSVSWEEFRSTTSERFAQSSWNHLWRSQFVSIEKARQAFGYSPAYAPEEAAREAVAWLIEHDEVKTSTPFEQPLLV